MRAEWMFWLGVVGVLTFSFSIFMLYPTGWSPILVGGILSVGLGLSGVIVLFSLNIMLEGIVHGEEVAERNLT